MRNNLTDGNIVKHYALGGDIDARSSWDDHSSAAACTPYDGTTIAPSGTPCSGFAPLPRLKVSFDGKGYAISNLYIYSGVQNVGLFSVAGVTEASIIKNLHLKSIRVHSTKTSGIPKTGGMIGALVNHIAISESSVTGKISGSGIVGGMIGYTGNSSLVVKNSYTDVTVRGTQFVGGITGSLQHNCRISSSHSRGSVTRTGTGYGGAGGLTGGLSAEAVTYNSYSHASVSGVDSVGSPYGASE